MSLPPGENGTGTSPHRPTFCALTCFVTRNILFINSVLTTTTHLLFSGRPQEQEFPWRVEEWTFDHKAEAQALPAACCRCPRHRDPGLALVIRLFLLYSLLLLHSPAAARRDGDRGRHQGPVLALYRYLPLHARRRAAVRRPGRPFFIANLLLFWLLLTLGTYKVHVARAFFIWISVFNLFIVSIFWSFMADLFRNEQSRRLFGFIAAGGTAGTVVGPSITVMLAVPFGPKNLLLISAALLGVSIFCVRRLVRAADDFKRSEAMARSSPEAWGAPKPADETAVIGGGILGGITELVKSPYLLGIGLFFLLFTSTSTVLYFEQAHIISATIGDPGQRTRIFAFMDLSVSTLTILTQLIITSRFIKYFGVSAAVSFLAVVTMAGFAFLAWAPTVIMLVGFQIIRRAANFAVTGPSRETLFTVVSREQKYKAKNFIDTVIYRGGDTVSGWAFDGLHGPLGLGLASIAAICVPISALWVGLSWMLGQHQDKLAQQAATPAPAPTTALAE